MSRILRAGVIGCGWSGSRLNEGKNRVASVYSHAAAYHRIPGVRLHCIADNNPDRLATCQKAWGVPAAYTDYREMLCKESVHVLSICTPDASHREVALEALAVKGIRGILCEKPLASTSAEAREIAQVAVQRNVRFAVNYGRRYAKGYQEVVRLLRARSLGRVERVHCFYSGGLIHNGTHLLDTLQWFFGPACEAKALSRVAPGENAEGIDALLHFAEGVSVVIQGIPSHSFPVFEVDILGTDARLTISRDGELIRRYSVRETRQGFDHRVLSRRPHVISTRLQDPTLVAVGDLLTAMRTGREPLCTAQDGVNALTMAEKILHSLPSVYAGRIHG